MTNLATTDTSLKRAELADVLAAHGHQSGWGRLARRVAVAFLIVGLAVLAATALRSGSGTPATTYATEAATRGTLDVAVSATGTLQPTNSVNVGSELSGLVEQVLVEENDRVRRGQVLARLDVSRLNDQVARSEAALASAQARQAQADATAREAQATLNRLREVSRLSGGKVPSATELETAEASLLRAQAEQASATASVNEARATLRSDRTNLAKASIRSPIDGVVLTRAVEPGQAVAASLQVATLFTIAENLGAMELEVDVDEADVGHVADGQAATFTVDAYPARHYTATVTRVAFGSRTSADVVSYPTVLKVKNEDLSLRPGMTASAEITVAHVEGALLVPNAALRFTPPATTGQPSRGLLASLMPGPSRGGGARQPRAQPTGNERTVWILRDEQLIAVSVTVGRTNGRITEITAGDLREGMAVITESTGSTS